MELGSWRAKNKNFKLKLRTKIPFYCVLFDNNRSFRSEVMVKNVTSQSEIAYDIFYASCCFLKLLFLTFCA